MAAGEGIGGRGTGLIGFIHFFTQVTARGRLARKSMLSLDTLQTINPSQKHSMKHTNSLWATGLAAFALLLSSVDGFRRP